MIVSEKTRIQEIRYGGIEMFCVKCGKQLNDGTKFCPECGAKQDAPALNDNFGSEDTVLLSEDTSALNDNFGSEDTVLLSEDTPALNDNFGSEDTVLLTEDTPALNDNFGSEDTVLLSEDTPALNDNFGSEDTVLLSEDTSALNDSFGSENTVLLSEEDKADTETESIFSDNFGGADAVIPAEEEKTPVIAPAADTDIFGASAPKSSDVFGNVDPFGNEIKAEEEKKEDIPPLKRREKAPKRFDDNEDTMPVPPIPPVYPQNSQPDYGSYNGQPQYQGQVPPPPQYPGQVPPPPYQEQPEAPAKERSGKQKKQRAKIGGGRVFGATLITVFCVVFTFVLSLLVSIKFGASPKSLRNGIEGLDSNTLFSAEYDDDELSNDLYKTLGIKGATDGRATKEGFKQYLIGSDILEFVGSNVEAYAKYIMEGKGDDPSIGSTEITNEFFGSKSNNTVAKKEMGVKFDSDALDIIERRLDKNHVDRDLSIKHWNDESGFEVKNAAYALSYITLGMLLALILVFLIWIAVIVDRRGRYVAGFYGNIFLISGLLMFLIGLGILGVSPILYAVTNNVVFYAVFHVLMKFGIISICTGFGELVLAFVFKRIKRSIKRTEKTAKAVAKAQQEFQQEVQYQ